MRCSWMKGLGTRLVAKTHKKTLDMIPIASAHAWMIPCVSMDDYYCTAENHIWNVCNCSR